MKKRLFRMSVCFAMATILPLLFEASDLKADPIPAGHKISIEGMKFVPENLEITVGDTIVWTNSDLVPHTVTARDKSFDSKTIAPNQSWKYVVTKKGNFPYVCIFHPTMEGRLIVK